MAEGVLSRSTRLFTLVGTEDDEQVIFRYIDGGTFQLDSETWQELGEPGVITVSVEAGDRLNNE